MRLSQRHLQLITGKEAPPPPNPVMDRLDRLETLLTNRPPTQISKVESVRYDDSAVMERLDRIEKLIELTKHKPSASYKFEINRDMNGKITNVIANKVPESHGTKTIYGKI
jgi:hypothetical protein